MSFDISTFYQIIHKGVLMWVQKSKVNVFVPKGVTFLPEDKEFIANNKDFILELLSLADINTKQDILYTIFKNSSQTSMLSYGQERLWFIDQYEGGSNVYNIPMVYKISLNINVKILEMALQSIVLRHDVLHSLIKYDSSGGYQFIASLSEQPFIINTHKVLTTEELESLINQDINYIFKLDEEYPIRINIINEIANGINGADEQCAARYISIVVHHIAFDGWSIDVFMRDLQIYYKYHLNQIVGVKDNELMLPLLNIQYKDFSVWQKNYLSGENLARQLTYWKTKLSDYENLNLPLDKPRPKQISYAGEDVYFNIDVTTSNKLRELAKELNVSLFSVFFAGFNLLLRSYSNQDDIVVGTPIANRHHHQLENLIGFFVNSLALRSKIDAKQEVNEYIQQIGNVIIESQLHQDLPFEKLVEELKIEQDASRHPVFQVMFGMHSFGGSKKLNSTNFLNQPDFYTDMLSNHRGAENEALRSMVKYRVAKFDLTVTVDDREEELGINFNYATSLFAQTTIQGFIQTYLHILRQISSQYRLPVSQARLRIQEITYLDLAAYTKVLQAWNKLKEYYPDDKLIHQRFEEQVEKFPDNIAVVHEGRALTYQELNQWSNQLAHYLRNTYKIQGDDLIALCLDRSEYILIAILGVMKSGAAYVPMDPSYPDERISYTIKDTGAKAIIANEIYQSRLSILVSNIEFVKSECMITPDILAIDNHSYYQELLLAQPIANPVLNIVSTNLAYVIYTSGTTGKPKGVLQQHNNVCRLFNATSKWYGFNDNDVWTLFHSYVFDFSVWELWGALCYGGKIIIPTYEITRDVEQFYNLCYREGVTVLNQTPQAFYQFSEFSTSASNSASLTKLRYVIFGGDKLDLTKLTLWFTRYGYTVPQLINMYGITETTVHVTYKKLVADDLVSHSCIGELIPDQNEYILDNNLNLLPLGAVGELYIGGAGLARGYLNQPELTSEKFIANPFQSEGEKLQGHNNRLYKTGDLVRYLPDGNIEYIGRNDFQVKIRGFRIELGEIESILNKYPGIKHAVVLAHPHSTDSGNKYLVAYYVSGTKLDDAKILDYLSLNLPDHMVPNVVVYLEQLPLTINGKLDRKALPEVEFNVKHNYVAPRNELESRICAIYAEMLGLSLYEVGIYDDYFRLGGNSILAIKLVRKLNQQLFDSVFPLHGSESKYRIKVNDIFKHRKIHNLLDSILSAGVTDEYIYIPQIVYSKEDIVNGKSSISPLSFAQERLWFIDKYEGGNSVYNIPLVIKLSHNIDLSILEQAIQNTVSRHEVLHSLIKIDNDGHAYQQVCDLVEHPVKIVKLDVTDKNQLNYLLIEEVNYIFQLNVEYPIRISLLNQSSTQRYLSVIIHHIAFDGWSIDVLLRDVTTYYHYCLNQIDGNQVLSIPELSIQYKDFAIWQRKYLSGKRLDQQLSYWKDQLNGYENLNLPLDKARPVHLSYVGDDVNFKIDIVTSAKLRNMAKQLHVSLYSLLLSGYYIFLYNYTNQDDIVVGIPIANRHYSQLEDLVGCFTNILALRTKINATGGIISYIKEIGNHVTQAQFHQDLPFEKLVEELKVVQDTSRHPIFQTMFGVQKFGEQTNPLVESWLSESNNILELIPLSELNIDYGVAKFDLSVFIDDRYPELEGSFNYSVSILNPETVNLFINTFVCILEQISLLTTDSKASIQDINYLNLESYNKLIYEWNQTERLYPDQKMIHELFEEQVLRTPHHTAVIYENKSLSYQELNHRSNQLAHYLRRVYDIQADNLIALCLDRSEYMLISILGVLKSGAGYVPIDPTYPDERIVYILHDIQARVILSNQKYHERLNRISSRFINDLSLLTKIELLDSLNFEGVLSKQPDNNLAVLNTSRNLAYVIYTSGTTGNPKGVMLEHAGIINRITWMNEKYPLTAKDRVLQKTPYVFDVSVWEFFWALWYGASVVFAKPEGHKDPGYLIDIINENEISVIHFVPSMLSVFAEYLDLYNDSSISKVQILPSLRYVFCSGEILHLQQVLKSYDLLPHVSIHNLYGPTEASVDVLFYDCIDENLTTVLIGKPIYNTQAYVLSAKHQLLPIGAIGELYIGGVGLSRGYLNKPELTAEKFIINPFQSAEDKLSDNKSWLYKTGDLARYMADGNIEYIGRQDFQVKIHGFRIELSEIEAVLLNSHKEIKHAIVTVNEHNVSSDSGLINKNLIAYYVAKSPIDESILLAYLLEYLPDYMLPTVFIWLTDLPVTLNGKLDRKALPNPNQASTIDENIYVFPRSKLEAEICDIYAEVLGIPVQKVGITNSFFKLGGDSITSIQVVSRLRQRLNLNIGIKDIFSYKSIERLYDNVIAKLADNILPAILNEQSRLVGEAMFLPIQKWFFSRFDAGLYAEVSHWNQSFLIKTEKLDQDLLQRSLVKLVDYHDAFRLRYRSTPDLKNRYIQYYVEESTNIELRYLDVKSLGETEGCQDFCRKLEQVLTNWQCGFSLFGDKGLYSIGYIDGYDDGSARVFFALHHLLIDAVSWRILTDDLKMIYSYLVDTCNLNKSSTIHDIPAEKILGAKGTSYRQWGSIIANYANKHAAESDYWNEVLSDLQPSKKRVDVMMVSESTHNHDSFELSRDITNKLLFESNNAYHTEINDLLLTALGLALSRLTSSEVNHIMLEGHGREEIEPCADITRTIGWFTSMYPVRLYIQSSDIGNSIRLVKENLRNCPNKGIGFGAVCGYIIQDLPRICFNYLGQINNSAADGSRSSTESKTQIKNDKWHIVGEAAGISISQKNINNNVININCFVSDGKLICAIESKLSKDDNTKFVQEMNKQLEDLVSHTDNLHRSYLTVSDVDHVVSQVYLDKIQENSDVSGVYLANSLQQGFIYHGLDQYRADDAYQIQLIFTYSHKLDIAGLKQAWEYALLKYPSLRLRFAWDEELVQIVDRTSFIDWRYTDLSQQNTINHKGYINQLIVTDRQNLYNLSTGRLLRVYLVKESQDKYSCILSYHHAILDGWSTPLLLNYVHETYLSIIVNQNPSMIATLGDHSYIDAQKYLQENIVKAEKFWQGRVDYLSNNVDLKGLLKLDKRHIRLNEYRHILVTTDETLSIFGSDYTQLKMISQGSDLTINVILAYAWHKLLSIYGNTDITIVGSTVSGRNIPIDGIENSVGLYINTLPVIVEHNNDESILDALKQLQSTINDINIHSEVNLAQLQKNGQRLFDSLFVFENYPLVSDDHQSTLKITLNQSIDKLDYPLGIVAFDDHEKLNITIKYAGELFDRDTILNLLENLHIIVMQVIGGIDQQQGQLNGLTDLKRSTILYAWNSPQINLNYSNHKTIHELFEYQVMIHPSAIAIVSDGKYLTYEELNQRSNQLAHYLRFRYQIKGDDLITLCLDRDEHMIIAILAVLKSGGAYVPIDPGYPAERIAHILTDTSSKVILSNSASSARLKELGYSIAAPTAHMAMTIKTRLCSLVNVLVIDSHEFYSQQLSIQDTINPESIVNSTNLAYVIYTSGTTGTPKGVLQQHDNVIRLLNATDSWYGFNANDIWTLFHAYIFDFSVWEIWGALCNGAKLVIPTYEQTRDFELFYELCRTEEVSVLNQTPTAFYQFMNVAIKKQVDNKLKLTNLRYIIFGGEALNLSQLKPWHNHYGFDAPQLVNMYGITETTVHVTYKPIAQHDVDVGASSLIGYMIPDQYAYILNSYLQPLPIGAVGELYVGGAGLARGYLNLVGLTNEKFIPNPFQTNEEKLNGNVNSRLYRTGDLVRYLPNGELEYIGRNDSQVKISGFRIELGEIEKVLINTHSDINQVVVLAYNGDTNNINSNNQYIVAYYVSPTRLDEDVLFSNLMNYLPDYMLPRAIIWKEVLPLTINGKLDKKALCVPALVRQDGYIAPRSKIEHDVCNLFAHALDVESSKISIRDGFFQLGGNSILAIKLINLVEDFFHIKIRVHDLFKNKTVELLSLYLLSKQSIQQNTVNDEYEEL